MNVVISVLREFINCGDVCFVFPSQVSSALWARKTCTLGIARSVAPDRFLAWDRFKEEVVRNRETNNMPVSLFIRKLFSESFVRKNKEAVEEFRLRQLIPPEYAGTGTVFAPFIARLLPSLAFWEKLVKERNESGPYAPDDEDIDYGLLKKEYSLFLKRYGLFEPSWEEMKLGEEGRRYVIFFPELIEDFTEYDALFDAPRFIRVESKAAEFSSQSVQALVCYKSAREEIRGAVLEIQRLHVEEGVPYEEMAVSVPGLEEIEPWLLREFSIRHIPVARRTGKNLGETGVGRFFSLVNEYAASRFSFNSLKALILNDHIPWRERDKNKALINFGIKYNCVSGYLQDGRVRDIWEDAFAEGLNDGGMELRLYYKKLKACILALANSKSFADIRKNYFAFRGGYNKKVDPKNALLDMENISETDNAVLGRCIEELGILIELEKKFNDPALIPSSPFAFFISCLNEKEYVLNRQKPGVNIYKWRVASAAPFDCHFVLNASESAASVLYQPLRFLRQDKRKKLGLDDINAAGSFFALCDTGVDESSNYRPRVRISASSQSYSGWAVPHSFFARGNTVNAPPCPEDAYVWERRLWTEIQKVKGKPELKKIYPLQRESYESWKNNILANGDKFSFFKKALSNTGSVKKLVDNAILDREGVLSFSPTTDLNVFYSCPLSWLYGKVFKIKEFSLEAALLDDTSLGILYHKILEGLFEKIKNTDGVFNSGRLDTYKHWALTITKFAIKEHPAFKGPLAVPIVSPQAAGIAKKIEGLLELEARFFNGFAVSELELPVKLKTKEFIIRGIIDRISLSPSGDPVIIDYKTSYIPSQTGIEDLDKTPLAEFQMPLYIKLCEEKLFSESSVKLKKVQGAYFYSINGRKIKAIVGEKSGGRNTTYSREDYEKFLEAAETRIEEFAQKLKVLEFSPEKTDLKKCVKCVYKTVCRSAYFLN